METLKALKAISDETRLRILNILEENELGVNEIAAVLKTGQSRISRHLKLLADSGFITARKDGLWVFYSLGTRGFTRDLAMMVIAEVRNRGVFAEDSQNLGRYIAERGMKGVEYFNRIAPEWKRIRDEVLGGLDIIPEILAVMESSGTAADLGCGNGELAALLQEKAARVICVDRSKGMLDEAGKYMDSIPAPRYDLRLGELEHLPMKDGEADCAVINMVLHYLDSPYLAIDECSRILNDNGRLIIAELAEHRNEEMRKLYGHRWLGFNRTVIKEWLKTAGFRLFRLKNLKSGTGLAVILYIAEKL